MEKVDQVDAHDNIVATITRKQAHNEELLHRGIIVLVFNPEGELFVQKRSAHKSTFPSLLEGSLSGHVKAGETYEQAALRELREELGIITTPAKLKFITRFGLHEGCERMLAGLYALRDYRGEPTLDKEEVESGQWIAIEALEKEMKKEPSKFSPVFLKAYSEFKDHCNGTKDYIEV